MKLLAATGLLAVIGASALYLAEGPRHPACGAAAMRAAAPSYLAVEAMPTTQTNVWTRAVGAYSSPPREAAIEDLALPSSWAPCDEKKAVSVPAEYAARYVGEAWYTALRAQNQVARLQYITSGSIPADRRCLPFTQADVRTTITTGYANLGADEASTGVRTQDLKAVPYFEHVLSLWKALAAKMDMTLPPVGSETAGWSERYFDQARAAKKQAPVDKDCYALPST